MNEASSQRSQAVGISDAVSVLPAGQEPLVESRLKTWHVATWLALLAAAAVAAFLDHRSGWLAGWSGGTGPIPYSALVLLGMALACEFMDATIGMGYGTTLSPILIALGYNPLMVVSAALLSQLLANILAAFFHHQAGNFNFWDDHRTRNTGLLLGLVGLAVSVATTAVTITLLKTEKIDIRQLRIAITIMVMAIGVFMLLSQGLKIRFRMRNVAILAGVAAFNKAFSGGGYGPLVCGGQVLVGLPIRASVASTAVGEAIVCVGAVATHYAMGKTIPLWLLLPLTAGALLSTPASAVTLRRLPQNVVKKLMAVTIIALCVYALVMGKGV